MCTCYFLCVICCCVIGFISACKPNDTKMLHNTERNSSAVYLWVHDYKGCLSHYAQLVLLLFSIANQTSSGFRLTNLKKLYCSILEGVFLHDFLHVIHFLKDIVIVTLCDICCILYILHFH